MVIGFNLESTVLILEEYNDEVQRIKQAGGLYFNGCVGRAERMRRDLVRAGLVGAEVVVATTSYTMTHESGTAYRYHHVVLWGSLIYDQSHTRRRPIPFGSYVQETYVETDCIYLWRRGDTSKPIWTPSMVNNGILGPTPLQN